MKTLFARFIKNESGATAIEYGLIAALISIVAIGAMGSAGTGVTGAFNNAAGALNR
jgi:pilus assembly protein Flp/PilA